MLILVKEGVKFNKVRDFEVIDLDLFNDNPTVLFEKIKENSIARNIIIKASNYTSYKKLELAIMSSDLVLGF